MDSEKDAEPPRKLSALQKLKAAKRAELKKKQSEKGLEQKVNLVSRDGAERGPVGLVYDEKMLLHHCPWDPHHIETPDRLSVIWSRCSDLGLVDRCHRIDARAATDEELKLYHTDSYVEKFGLSKELSVEDTEKKCREYDSVYMCSDTDMSARLASGSSIDLVENVLDNKIHSGLGLVRPPGHHAMADTPCGFCGYNNIVLAAQVALNRGLKKILIVDFDLHHGQGTQYAFYNDPRVLYMSVHRYEKGDYWPHLRESNFDHIGEGAGAGFNVNVALNIVGCGPSDYLAVFQRLFLPIAVEYDPDLVLVSAGYDAALGCPEGEMSVTPSTYAHFVWSLAQLAGGRMVVLLEGGYCLPSLAESAALSLRCLLGDPCPPVVTGDVKESVMESIRGCVTALRKYWKCLDIWKTVSDEDETILKKELCFIPDTSFSPPVSWPPAEFPTRDYYLVYDEATAQHWRTEVARLVLNTDLKCADVKLCILYDPEMMNHKNELEDEDDHPECPERISRIYQALSEAGITCREYVKTLPCGRKLTQEECGLVHDKEHWIKMMDIQNLNQDEKNNLADGFNSIYLNQFSVDCGLLSAGGVLACVDEVMASGARTGLAVVRPPGHHAEPDTPHGFCLFNNVAIAARYAISSLGMERVLILDWDVHHGNGIQHMFYNDNRVLYISLHRYDHASFFPQSEDANYDMVGDRAGEGFNINIPWNGRKMGDTEYFLAFQNIVLPIGYQYNPDLVLVSAGFDAAVGDPLGGYKVTPAMYGYMTHQLCQLGAGKVVVALEGGYNLSTISECATQCARALLGDPLPRVSIGEPRASAVETIRNVIKQHRQYWSCLALHDKILPKFLDSTNTTLEKSESLENQMTQMSIESGPKRSVTRSQLQAQAQLQ